VSISKGHGREKGKKSKAATVEEALPVAPDNKSDAAEEPKISKLAQRTSPEALKAE
jgi:hypothetical protein